MTIYKRLSMYRVRPEFWPCSVGHGPQGLQVNVDPIHHGSNAEGVLRDSGGYQGFEVHYYGVLLGIIRYFDILSPYFDVLNSPIRTQIMASIRKRIKTDGSIGFIAEIVIKRDKQILHRESRSFSSQKLAKAWASRREVELENTEVYGKQKALKIADILQEYSDRFDDYGRSKKQVMNALIRSDLGQINIYQLTGSDLIRHCLERRKTAKPQTVKNDMIWLKSALSVVKGLHGYSYSLDLFDSANKLMRKEHIIGSVESRDRRPTKEELWKLSRYFYRMKTPYLHIMWFAIYSARRQAEIMDLRRDDINHDNKTVMVRDMKTPGKKVLNMRLKLPKSAYKIIMRQPKTGAIIFPYNAKSIGTGFARACKALNIKDLRFHDMRKEAISRLAEAGLSIEQIAQVSGHHDWSSLKIYFHPDPGNLDI